MKEPEMTAERTSASPLGDARTVAATGADTHERQPRSRVLRIRVTDSESGRLRVSLALPIGLVRVAIRQGARLLPPGQEGRDLLLAAERSDFCEPVIVHDEKHGEQIEVSIEG